MKWNARPAPQSCRGGHPSALVAGEQLGHRFSFFLARVNKLKPASCIPNNLTGDQAKLIIEKFMKDNPQYMQLSAEMVAAHALVIAFPCP
jgi:hypothetical protein